MKSALKVSVALIAMAVAPAMVQAHSNENNTSSDPTRAERANPADPTIKKHKRHYHRNRHTEDGVRYNDSYRGNDARYAYNSNYNYGDQRSSTPYRNSDSWWYSGSQGRYLGMRVDSYDYPEMNDVNLVKHAH